MEQAGLYVLPRFEIYNRIYQIPSLWGIKDSNKKSEIHPNSKEKIQSESNYRAFYCASFGQLLFCIYTLRILLNPIFSSKIDQDFTLKAAFLSILFFFIGILVSSCNYQILAYHKEFSFVFTEMTKLRVANSLKLSSKKIHDKCYTAFKLLLDVFWILILCVYFLVALLPFIEDVDPAYFMLKEMLPGLESKLAGRLIRSVMSLTVGFQWLVCITHIILFNVVILDMSVNVLKMLTLNQNPTRVVLLLKENPFNHIRWKPLGVTFQLAQYRQFCILIKELNHLLRLGLAVGFGSASALFIVAGSSSIWFFGKVPLTTLLIFPSMIIIVEISVYLIALPAGLITELSSSLLTELLKTLSKSQSKAQIKLLSKQIVSLRSVGVEFGYFFTFKKSTSWLMSSIWVEKTITLFLIIKAYSN